LSIFSEILEIYRTPAARDVTPISGYIMYPEGYRTGTFTVASIQDIEEEDAEVFSIRLVGSKGGAIVSDTDSTALLTGKSVFGPS
jgi:hypothetical protein